MPPLAPAPPPRHPPPRSAPSPTTFAIAFAWALLAMYAAHAVDFPGSLVDFTRATGGGVLLDLKPSFSEAGVYQRLASYGAAGRDNYAFRNLTVDVLLPLSLLPFLFLLMRYALARLALPRAARAGLLALPLAYVAFDLAENASVLLLLARFPERLPTVAQLLPYLTVIKRAAVVLSIVVPLSVVGVSTLFSELRGR